MKLSVSNIAWPNEDCKKVLEYLAGTAVSAIEIAPSRIWPDFRSVNANERKRYYQSIRNYGLSICSMHSLYYGQKCMHILGNSDERKRFSTFTRQLIELAYDLEIPVMIFGSPVVRDRRDIPVDEALEYAAEALRPLSDYAYSSGTKILIEALSKEDTDFINTHNEAISLVEAVNSKGFGLHLDAKAISSEKQDYETIFEDCKGLIEHFHINENKLGGFEKPVFDHVKMAECLGQNGYEGFASIEMRQLPDYMSAIKIAVDFAEKEYLSVKE